MEFREFINNKINKNKLGQIKNNEFFNLEKNTLNNDKVQRYYKYIIENIDLDKKNINNSYVMWLIDKVEEINFKKPSNIIPGHISLPDIDIDIGVDFREKVINYLTERWGQDRVAQMITFGRLQGKAALKEVFRAQPELVKHLTKVKYLKLGKKTEEINSTPHEICNEITSFFPNEAEIIDDLQEIRDESENETYGIIDWCLDNVEQVQEAYKWYKPLFDQAKRIEGTKKNSGKHAAGIVIADRPIQELVPMSYDAKTKNVIVGLEMSNAESMGCCKFDFLGVVALDKMRMCQNLINGVNENE